MTPKPGRRGPARRSGSPSTSLSQSPSASNSDFESLLLEYLDNMSPPRARSPPQRRRLPMSVQTDSCLQIIKPVWLLDEAKESNFVFSPFSIYAALSLLASGSDGLTLEQILSFLKSSSLDHLNSVASQLIDLVDGTKIEGGGAALNLSFVSGIWLDNYCTLKPRFKEIASTIYNVEAENVDFKTKADEVRETVNEWVEEKTNGLIKDLLPDGSIHHDTRLVLANALYFKAEWDQEFDSSKTKLSEFYLLDGSSIQVPFMTHYKKQYISCFIGFKVLGLPYKQQGSSGDPHQKQFSMYIFLPDKRDGLGGLIERVCSDPSFIDRHLPDEKVLVREFSIPKFKISFGFEASTILKTLGLVLPFDVHQADFNEMVDGGELYVSSVHHKCFVEVDEVGTKAAAATGIGGSSWGLDGEPVGFVADHPFMFTIRDDLSGMVLFIGHVLNPSLNV